MHSFQNQTGRLSLFKPYVSGSAGYRAYFNSIFLFHLIFEIEVGVSLEVASLFLWGRGKAVYILPSDPTLPLLSVGFTEYDNDF
ncbi:hypothetical protein Hanom_Chr09g00853151 [Helianthus anomalus]